MPSSNVFVTQLKFSPVTPAMPHRPLSPQAHLFPGHGLCLLIIERSQSPFDPEDIWTVILLPQLTSLRSSYNICAVIPLSSRHAALQFCLTVHFHAVTHIRRKRAINKAQVLSVEEICHESKRLEEELKLQALAFCVSLQLASVLRLTSPWLSSPKTPKSLIT